MSPSKVLLPPLHIKLGLMKQFVKALNKEGDCFKYICEKFPILSEEKLKEGIFKGPDIRKLMSDAAFKNTTDEKEKAAWICFCEVVSKFLGNNKDPNYRNIVANMLEAYKELGCNMSMKIHFLFSHLDYFPENLGFLSEEQGERFHKDVLEFERRYQGCWSISMLADYCWMLKREIPEDKHKRKRNRRTFSSKKQRV